MTEANALWLAIGVNIATSAANVVMLLRSRTIRLRARGLIDQAEEQLKKAQQQIDAAEIPAGGIVLPLDIVERIRHGETVHITITPERGAVVDGAVH
jgi:hypothetical protein